MQHWQQLLRMTYTKTEDLIPVAACAVPAKDIARRATTVRLRSCRLFLIDLCRLRVAIAVAIIVITSVTIALFHQLAAARVSLVELAFAREALAPAGWRAAVILTVVLVIWAIVGTITHTVVCGFGGVRPEDVVFGVAASAVAGATGLKSVSYAAISRCVTSVDMDGSPPDTICMITQRACIRTAV